MKLKSIFITIAIVISVCGMISGCDKIIGSNEEETSAVSVTLMTDAGNGVESELNETARLGLEDAEAELGIEGRNIKCSDTEDMKSNIDILVKAGKTDLIIGAGERFEEVISVEAAKYPKQKFAVIDADKTSKPHENVVYISFDDERAGFMAGFIAGKMTSKNKIACIGSDTNEYISGFEKGAKTANDKIEEILTRNADPMSDPEASKDAANDVTYYGADVIFAPLPDDSKSVIDRVDNSTKIIAVNTDQYTYSKEKVIASIIKSYKKAVYNVSVMAYNEEDFKGGQNIFYSAKDGGIALSSSTENTVPPDVIMRLDKALKEEYK